MLQKLRASLLTEAHAKKLHIQPMTEELAAALGVEPAWAGFKIPYFDADGRALKDFYRYRFWPESKPSKGFAALVTPSRPLRYVQPKNSELHVYMPPLLAVPWSDVVKDTSIDIFITEGELKAACACTQGFTMLGVGGVFSWMSKKHGQALIPELERFKWKERRVYLCFDSDKSTNPMVQLALSRLALTLTARGAKVWDVNIPPDGESKQGVDDLIAAYGVEKFASLLAGAVPISASEELHRLNDEVALIWSGGPAGNIIRHADSRIITPQQFTRSLYKNRTYLEFTLTAKGEPGAAKTKFAAEEWLCWPHRARVNSITYAPGRPHIIEPDGDYNLWQPSPLVPKAGDISPWLSLLEHMFKGASAADVTWFKRWLAYPLVHPGTKLFSCVLLWSHTGGTGKNLLAEAMEPVYGSSNYVTIKSRHLLSDFNSWAEGKQFIVGDEITLDDKRHTSGDLKAMLTSQRVRINRKGIESYEVPDCANYYFTSNDPSALSLEPGERRTFVYHVNETPIGYERGVEFINWCQQGGSAAIAHYLTEELDLGNFNRTAPPPETMAKSEMIENSRSDVDSWAVALRLNPDEYLTRAVQKFSASTAPRTYSVYRTADLLALYDPDNTKRATLRTLAIALDKAGFKKSLHNNGRLGNVRATFWLIRGSDNLTSAQAARIYQTEREDTAPRNAASGAGRRVQ